MQCRLLPVGGAGEAVKQGGEEAGQLPLQTLSDPGPQLLLHAPLALALTLTLALTPGTTGRRTPGTPGGRTTGALALARQQEVTQGHGVLGQEVG